MFTKIKHLSIVDTKSFRFVLISEGILLSTIFRLEVLYSLRLAGARENKAKLRYCQMLILIAKGSVGSGKILTLLWIWAEISIVKEDFWPGKILKLLTKILIAKEDLEIANKDFDCQTRCGERLYRFSISGNASPGRRTNVYQEFWKENIVFEGRTQCHQDLLIYCSRWSMI